MNENLYLKHIESIPSLLEEVFSALDKEAARIAKKVSEFPLKCVYLYGSGDSWSAALGATGAFMQLCNLPSFALTSMQASRYAPGYCMPEPDSVLVIGISNSGYMVRGVEATMAMAKAGYHPVLITSNPDSPGARAASYIFNAPVPSFDPVPIPGVRSFAVAQVSLYLLAVHLAKETDKISSDHEKELIAQIRQLCTELSDTLDQNRIQLQSFAELCAREERVEFLAAGPCRASSDFGMAKTLEATGYTALSPELEEFAHMNFFSLYPEHIPTVLICSEDARCYPRCLEMEKSMKRQKRPCLIITDSTEFEADRTHTVFVPFKLKEYFAPLIFSFLVAALTAYMPLKEGDDYMHGHRGPYFEGPFKDGEGFPTIMKSKITL